MSSLSRHSITLKNKHILNYWQIGVGKPLILLIGSDATATTWNKKFVELLAVNHSVYLLDYWGINSTVKTIENLNFRTIAEDIYLFSLQLNLKKINIFGWSMGGGVATQFAVDYPQILEKLILAAPVTPNNFLTKGFIGRDYSTFTHKNEMLDFIFGVNYNNYNPILRKQLQQSWLRPNAKPIPNKEISLAEATAIEKWRIDAKEQKIPQSLDVPTLWLIPSNDLILDLDSTLNDFKLQRKASRKLIKDCGHNISLQYPELTAQLITQFVSPHITQC